MQNSRRTETKKSSWDLYIRRVLGTDGRAERRDAQSTLLGDKDEVGETKTWHSRWP